MSEVVESPYGLLENTGTVVAERNEKVSGISYWKEKISGAVSADAPLLERMEFYEDFVDSEVGDTTFVRARHIERTLGMRQLFLKFEGSNPTGTQKDRIAFAQVQDAMRWGFDTITVASCGNYGVAVSLAAALARLRCIVFIPSSYHSQRIKQIESLGGEVLRVEGDYENAVLLSRARAQQDEYYDANPGGDNLSLQLQAYGQIAFEIYDELRDAPAVVAVPVSNGTTLAGIYKGFLQLYRRGKISRMPRFVAGSSYKKNPIVQSFLAGKTVCEDLNPRKIRETGINEPLINWHAIDGQHALSAILETNGWAKGVTDKQMVELERILRKQEGWNVMPASTAGLSALLNSHTQEPLTNDRYVAIITGKDV